MSFLPNNPDVVETFDEFKFPKSYAESVDKTLYETRMDRRLRSSGKNKHKSDCAYYKRKAKTAYDGRRTNMGAKQQCVPLLCKETVVLNNLFHALVPPQDSVSNEARKDNSEPSFSLALGSELDLESISDVRSVPDLLVGLPATVPVDSGEVLLVTVGSSGKYTREGGYNGGGKGATHGTGGGGATDVRRNPHTFEDRILIAGGGGGSGISSFGGNGGLGATDGYPSFSSSIANDYGRAGGDLLEEPTCTVAGFAPGSAGPLGLGCDSAGFGGGGGGGGFFGGGAGSTYGGGGGGSSYSMYSVIDQGYNLGDGYAVIHWGWAGPSFAPTTAVPTASPSGPSRKPTAAPTRTPNPTVRPIKTFTSPCTLHYLGAAQGFTVPEGVSALNVTLYGGSGGRGTSYLHPGSFGGRDRILVAGGGGGGGGGSADYDVSFGGDGGDGGLEAKSGSPSKDRNDFGRGGGVELMEPTCTNGSPGPLGIGCNSHNADGGAGGGGYFGGGGSSFGGGGGGSSFSLYSVIDEGYNIGDGYAVIEWDWVGPSHSPTSAPTGPPTTFPTEEPSAGAPTERPSKMPTPSPSLMPTSPSADPSVKPSTGPTFTPTKLPTGNPSGDPTTPTCPSVLPSMTPSIAPSLDPTVTPSAKPSALPSQYPSAVPSPAPTVKPSADPFPMKTEISFQCSMDLTGTDKDTFASDTAAQQAVIAAFAAGMNNTSVDQVSITNITDTTSRRLSSSDRDLTTSGNLRAGVKISDASIAITLKVRRILEVLGLTAEDGAALYSILAAQINTAVSSGDFTTRLTARLTESGSSISLTPQTETFSVGDYSMRVVATPVPSLRPVITPTIGVNTPTFIPTAAIADKTNDAGMPLGALVGIIVAAVVLALGIGAILYFQSINNSTGKVHVTDSLE
eukprot:gene9282-10940_t